MAAYSSTLAHEYTASSHRNSNGTEHHVNIELADHPLSSSGTVETEELAPAVTAHGEENTPAMADNVDATVSVQPAPTPTVAPPTPTTPLAPPTPTTPLAPPTPTTPLAPPTPKTPRCEIEFRNLMAFRGLPNTKENLCKVALEDWQSSAELMGKRVEKRQKEIRSTRNEIYQVVGFYSAFQGLLLTAVAQSSLLHWNNRGYPLALSAFATCIAATGVVQKNKIISGWKKTIASENPARKVPCFCLFWIILKVFNRSQSFSDSHHFYVYFLSRGRLGWYLMLVWP
ncbi:unnamed protein product [Sphagnum jensenii]|uniref:Uncharacterized protein n=1 Tax=Sphagnum jensenii TaxID=128206 RepID=A0ABP0VAQ6_9BRYO